MSKIVGWNIFVEVKNDDGQLELVAWNISDYIAQQIDREYKNTYLGMANTNSYELFELPNLSETAKEVVNLGITYFNNF